MIENKNKKKKRIIIVFIIAVILLISLLIFLIFNKQSTTKENKNIKEKNKNIVEKSAKNDESVTFTNEELKKYINYINPVSIGPSALIYDNDKVESNKLSNADKIKYIGSLIYSKHTTSENYEYDIVNENDVKDFVEEVYGPNTYERTTFNLGCGDYILNGDEGKYYSRTGCGGMSTVIVENTVIDYKATKNKLEITTAYAFVTAMDNLIYKDYKLENNVSKIENETDNINEQLSTYIENNKESLNHIIYTFESEDGINYYFKEFKNIK